jgi:hypothetical protein
MAPGPLVLDGEHAQRQRYDHQARPGGHQQHHANGEDHRAHDGNRNPAQQPNQVLHACKNASTPMMIWPPGSPAGAGDQPA